MDKERRKKIQTTKLIITEIFMLVIVVFTVVILTFIVMGYHLNEDGKLEQSGLVQVDSIPTGAKVVIDGEVLPNETNTSKILPEGEHTVRLEKGGYTSWTKTVTTHPGFLTKLSYPHLFRENAKTEVIKKFEQKPLDFIASKNRTSGLLKYPGNKFEVLNLEAKTPPENTLDLTKLFDGDPEETKLVDWSENGERLIVSSPTSFFVINLEHPENSLNLSSELDLKISDLHFLNSQGDRLAILENGNLRTVSLADKKLSEILLKNVLFFSNYNHKIVATLDTKNSNKKIVLYDTTNKSEIKLADSIAEDARAFISEYAGRYTMVFIKDNYITIYRTDLPTEDISKDNSLGEPVGKYTLDFKPKDFAFAGKNQLISTSSDSNFAVFDLENYKLSSYTLGSNLTFWADDYIIGFVSDGKLVLNDFDNTNSNTFKDAESGFPAFITKDNNFLYYITKDDSNNLNLVRDLIK